MRLIIVFLSILIISKFYAQKAIVQLTCEQTQADVNEKVSFTVKTNISGNIKIDYPKTFLRAYGNMSGMQQEVNYSTGEISTIYYLSQEGIFKSSGCFTIYAYVETSKKIYKSNAIKITIGGQDKNNNNIDDEISCRILKQPIFGLIKTNKDKIYEGEALFLEAKVFTKLHINMMSDYRAYEYSGDASSKEIEQNDRLALKKEMLNGQEFLSFSHDKRIIFPRESGKFRIKPYEMSIQYENGSIFSDELTFTSNAKMIEVLPLPKNSPKEFTGVVGNLSLKATTKEKNVALDDVFELTLNIEGEGNIHLMQTPKFKLPKEFQFYADPETKEHFSFDKNGSSGKITYTYFIKALKKGDYTIPSFKIAYFSPSKEKYEMAYSNPIKIEVENNNIASNNLKINNNDKNNSLIQSFSEKENKKNNDKNSNLWWSIASPFLLVLIGGLLFIKIKQNKEKVPEIIAIKTDLKDIYSLREDFDKINFKDKNNYKEMFKQLNDWILSFSLIFDDNKANSLQDLLKCFRNNSVTEEFINEIETFYLNNEEKRYSYYFDKSEIENCINKSQMFLQNFELLLKNKKL